MSQQDIQQSKPAYFYSSYLHIAKQIQHKTGIRGGNCLEISAGGGHLGIALAQITNLHIYLMENSDDMLSEAAENFQARNMEERICLLKGLMPQIPLPDGTIDLVVSRCSILDWENN